MTLQTVLASGHRHRRDHSSTCASCSSSTGRCSSRRPSVRAAERARDRRRPHRGDLGRGSRAGADRPVLPRRRASLDPADVTVPGGEESEPLTDAEGVARRQRGARATRPGRPHHRDPGAARVAHPAHVARARTPTPTARRPARTPTSTSLLGAHLLVEADGAAFVSLRRPAGRGRGSRRAVPAGPVLAVPRRRRRRRRPAARVADHPLRLPAGRSGEPRCAVRRHRDRRDPHPARDDDDRRGEGARRGPPTRAPRRSSTAATR